jgi:iron(III) transport system permease protein
LYAMIRFDTFTTAIVDQLQSTYNGLAAHMLAGVLVVCCIVLLSIEWRIRGPARYARVGSGAPRRRARLRLGHWTAPSIVFVGIVVVLSLGVPITTVLGWLLKGGAASWKLDELWSAIWQTLLLAVVGAIGATLAAFPVAWLSVRVPGRATRLVESCNYFVGSLPGVVVALALVSISVRLVRPLYQTLATVLLAYVVMFLPRALVSLRVSIAQVPIALEEAASSLGRAPLRILGEITLRLAAPGAGAAMALAGLGITNELTATLMLAPNGTQTLAILFWAYSSEIDYAAAAPYALLMVLFALPMTLLLHHQIRRATAQ